MQAERNLRGIRGWLLLPLLSLVVSPLRSGWRLLSEQVPIFTEGHWQVLTSPGNDAYHPAWAPLILFEVIGTAAFFVAAPVLFVLFLRRWRYVPGLMIAFYGLAAILPAADLALAIGLLPDVTGNSDAVRDIVGATIAAAIWIPYFLVSRRVKVTFVN
jgi:hypothetical protein